MEKETIWEKMLTLRENDEFPLGEDAYPLIVRRCFDSVEIRQANATILIAEETLGDLALLLLEMRGWETPMEDETIKPPKISMEEMRERLNRCD